MYHKINGYHTSILFRIPCHLQTVSYLLHSTYDVNCMLEIELGSWLDTIHRFILSQRHCALYAFPSYRWLPQMWGLFMNLSRWLFRTAIDYLCSVCSSTYKVCWIACITTLSLLLIAICYSYACVLHTFIYPSKMIYLNVHDDVYSAGLIMSAILLIRCVENKNNAYDGNRMKHLLK